MTDHHITQLYRTICVSRHSQVKTGGLC